MTKKLMRLLPEEITPGKGRGPEQQKQTIMRGLDSRLRGNDVKKPAGDPW